MKGKQMKKNKTFLLGLCALAVALTALYVVNENKNKKQTQNKVDESMVTQEAAVSEISFINITAEETEFLKQILASEDVAKAKEENKDAILNADNATKLAQEHLAKDTVIGEISFRNKSVFVDYYLGEYRMIYEMPPDGTTHKYVGTYDENKNAKALFENTDNKTYKKVVFNTIAK